MMELKDWKFYYGGDGLNFAVFADSACRTKHVESILVALTQTRVEVYEIEPGVKTQWAVVRQVEGNQSYVKLFVRQGESFVENESRDLSSELRREIEQRFPRLISSHLSRVA